MMISHFIVEAVQRVDIQSLHVSRTGSGKTRYRPRMMLGLLIWWSRVQQAWGKT
jgi:hypothetical protein